MSNAARERLERRLLILAPTGKDAALACEMLGKAGFECAACADLPQLARELERGAGAVLIAEEAVSAGGGALLADAIGRQPTWSDLPVLLLAGGRGGDAAAAKAVELLGNITLLERPVRIGTLASAVRTALRARERQYQARAHFREREEADQRKDEFLATLAHELRNPLAPIRNAVQVLRLSNGAAPTGQLAEMMERQVAQMVRLVDDLLEVSRITRGKIELRKARVALAAVIEAAVETARPLIESSRHELTVEAPPRPLYLDADATRLAQVFANLLNNAAKYTDPGGQIVLAAAREGDEATVSVRDNGIGIGAPALARVFDMFVQVHQAGDRMQGGLGIGLTLVRRLVEMHGGSVLARSAGAGKGSEFVVRLPLAAGPAAAAAATSASPRAEAVKAPPRVLVVDDNRDAADSLGMLLQLLGADVAVVNDGSAALQAIEVRQPAAVFLDLGMPGMDGYEVARRIRQRPDAAELTLVALTGWGQERDRRRTREAGFDHHLIKPADLDALQALLESIGTRQTEA